MALNPFFLQGSRSEQNLVQSLINEQLKMYGVEVYYIPRDYINTNTIIREVIQSEFQSAFPIEAYVQNFDGFEGSSDLMTKFGVRVTDDLDLVISKERYESYIRPLVQAKYINNPEKVKLYDRPKEGDLVWFPLSDTLFEIKFVEHEQPFYQLKKNYVYTLKCEIFEYSDEVIDTGIVDIDDVVKDDGYILQLNLAGIGETALAYTTINVGAVNKLTLMNSGAGYTSQPPIVAISSAPNAGETATAVAIMTSFPDRDGWFVNELKLINPGFGYTEPPAVTFISNTGGGAIATAGISTTLNSIGIVTITNSGEGYATVPEVTFSSPGTGVTATGTAKMGYNSLLDSNVVTQIQITNAGYGYTTPPTITIDPPPTSFAGSYTYNEIVTGTASSTTARVKDWNSQRKELKVYDINGTFKIGEELAGEIGVSTTRYTLVSTGTTAYADENINLQQFDSSSQYDENIDIEREGINIIDFTEKNPFGTF